MKGHLSGVMKWYDTFFTTGAIPLVVHLVLSPVFNPACSPFQVSRKVILLECYQAFIQVLHLVLIQFLMQVVNSFIISQVMFLVQDQACIPVFFQIMC